MNHIADSDLRSLQPTIEAARSALLADPSRLIGQLRLFHKLMEARPGSPWYPNQEQICELAADVAAFGNRADVIDRAVALLTLVLPSMLEVTPQDDETVTDVVDRGTVAQFAGAVAQRLSQIAESVDAGRDGSWFGRMCEAYLSTGRDLMANRVVGTCLIVAAMVR